MGNATVANSVFCCKRIIKQSWLKHNSNKTDQDYRDKKSESDLRLHFTGRRKVKMF